MLLNLMKTRHKVSLGLAVMAMAASLIKPVSAADKPPYISTFSRPVAGSMQMLFHGTGGPFKVQTRQSLDASAPWTDVANAIITEVQPGVMTADVPMPAAGADLRFY